MPPPPAATGVLVVVVVEALSTCRREKLPDALSMGRAQGSSRPAQRKPGGRRRRPRGGGGGDAAFCPGGRGARVAEGGTTCPCDPCSLPRRVGEGSRTCARRKRDGGLVGGTTCPGTYGAPAPLASPTPPQRGRGRTSCAKVEEGGWGGGGGVCMVYTPVSRFPCVVTKWGGISALFTCVQRMPLPEEAVWELNAYACAVLPQWFHWTTLQIVYSPMDHQMPGHMHCNPTYPMSAIVTRGIHDWGECLFESGCVLWTGAPWQGRELPLSLVRGGTIMARAMPRWPGVIFNPWAYHGSGPWRGTCCVVVHYTGTMVDYLPKEAVEELRSLGFCLPYTRGIWPYSS